MSKRKILLVALSLCMVAILAVGGSLAYLMDTDYNINVMTVGNVKIDQIERQRSEDGKTIVEFADGKVLVPAVFYDENGNVEDQKDGYTAGATVPTHSTAHYDDILGTTEHKGTGNLLDGSLKNEIDKIVTVKNTGSRPAYIRTIFLMQDKVIDENAQPEAGKYLTDTICFMWENSGNGETGYYNVLKDADGNKILVEIEGKTYSVQTHYYAVEVGAGETTAPSLKQFYMDPDATNEVVAHLISDTTTNVGSYEILVMSQAVQSEGFNDDRVALDTAFGEVNADNVVEWFTKAEMTKSKDISAEAEG